MNVLSIAVHPDDETLGCGATLLKHAAAGAELHWLVVTAATEPSYSAAAIAQQAEQVEAVRQAYPFSSLTSDEARRWCARESAHGMRQWLDAIRHPWRIVLRSIPGPHG